MESGRLPPTKATMVQAVQGATPGNATATDATNDVVHMERSTKSNEQHAMDSTNEPVATAGEQGMLTIRGEE